MTVRGVRIAVWLGLLTLGGIYLHFRLHSEATEQPERMAWAARASTSLAFILSENAPLHFPVARGVSHVRLLLNGDLEEGALQEALQPRSWDRVRFFEVATDLLDAEGKSIQRRTWTLTAQVSAFRAPDTGQIRPATFHLNRSEIPSNTREILLNAGEGVRGIRLALLRKDPRIGDIMARACLPSDISTSRARHGWARLPEISREQMSAGSIYPHTLLRDQEKRNLILNAWRPLAPSGSWFASPPHRTIYHALEPLEPETGELFQPTGLPLGPELVAVIPLPPSGAQLILRCTASEPGISGEEVGGLRSTWTGPGTRGLEQRNHPWHDQDLEIRGSYPGGTLVLESRRVGRLRAFAVQDGQEVEITPRRMELGHCRLSPGEEVTFAVASDRLPFRVDLRSLLDQTPSPGRIWYTRKEMEERWNLASRTFQRVSYALLDGNGQTLRQGRLPVDTLPSAFDQLPRSLGNMKIGLPVTSYLRLAPGTRAIKIRQDGSKTDGLPSVLVAVFNRPETLVKDIRIPEDLFSYDVEGTRMVTWFPLRPAGLSALNQAGRWIPVRVQLRPDSPEEDLSQPYELDPLPVQGHPIVREILSPREVTGLPPREEGLPAYFRELVPGREQTVDLRGVEGLHTIQPSLLCFGATEGTAYQVFFDGHPLLEGTLSASFQEVILPPVMVGSHRIKFDLAGRGRVYLNHVWPSPQDRVRRAVYPLERGQSHTFTYQRTRREEEVLGLRWFGTAGSGASATLRVLVQGGDPPIGLPQPSWTLRQRRFIIRSGPGATSEFLSQTQSRLDQGQMVALRLGAELPPGTYRVECTLEAGASGHVALSRAQVGARAKTLLNRESLLGGSQ